ncbi:cadherin-related family member 2 isoform X1 [Nannospalax galili]|uniref:cadherin-related family member 2 isoform X1 n=1 Tax=Nannospalax galili TaxID=1026970 RepID=UPI000819A7C4|nr:cadherin-related family member 2 isoform X1 [Nannospalax galili]
MAQLWWLCVLLPVLMVPVTANRPPQFLENMTAVKLPEDLPVGAVAFWLVAESDNYPLTYGISGSNAYFFSVTSDTGEVKLDSTLDYETLSFFPITISVKDSYNSLGQREMNVIVEDRNDNAPVFRDTMFSTTINETLPVGSVVFSVRAEDKDTGQAGMVQYQIEEVIPNSLDNKYLFYMLDDGSIVLNGSLSYNNKSAFYQLELRACDLGGMLNGKFVKQCSRVVYLSISVVDQPDLDPQFVREFYSASVAEDVPLNTSVVKVEAVDSDKGIGDSVTYSISSSTRPGWFDIEAEGIITVSSPLDREQLLEENEEVQLQVTATEKNLNIYGQEANVSIWVTIKVTDVNDHKPEFYNCSLQECLFGPQEAQVNFTGYVDEHASARIPIDDLTMVVYDPDQGNNGTFLLSLEGPDAEAFSVSPGLAAGSADVQVLVRNSELVDYEKSPTLHVQVVAADFVSKNFSVAMVTIYLTDINDHRPTFPESSYELSVPEHSPTGFEVTSSIHAVDEDKGKWGHITYSLLSGNGEDLFEVDPNSGTVKVKNGSLLDREKQAVYYLTLQATDSGNQSASTTLKITLLDINDNAPEVQGSYNIFVTEEEGTVSVTIQAYDNDQPDTNNSRLLFSLLPGPYSHNFSLDSNTGLLTNEGPLDREAIDPVLEGRIVLTVCVADYGVPSLSTDVNVTINVEDINDNLPIFNQSSYQFSVMERDPGVLVGTVEAWDADQTDVNNRISFSLSGTGANNFMLQSSVLEYGGARGNLWLLPDVSLDYEAQIFLSLNVTAENSGSQGHEIIANVTIKVVDVNDEPPTLDAASLQGISVAENGSQYGQVAEIVPKDVDTAKKLEIELVNVICTKAGVDVGSLCHGWFSVAVNGSVYINQSEAIDYEACHLVTLVVRAHDLTTDSRFEAYSNNGSLPITIEDKNDNEPYFLPDNQTFVIIPELVLPKQRVASVQATDEDSGKNGVVTFDILQANFVSNDGVKTPVQVFEVSTSGDTSPFTGSIELRTSLDSTVQGTYQVTVQAKDNPYIGPALEAQITLNLFTVDQSYRVRLQFSTTKDDVAASMEEIRAALIQATRTTMYVVTIQNIDSMARARAYSYLDAYFVFPNGTALMLTELNMMIRKDQDSLRQLLQLGLVVVSSQESQDSDQQKQLISVIIGLVVALALVLVIMVVALGCLRKSYNRKLRAVKASKEAQKTAEGVTSSPAAIPGTNMYKTERANPVLNLHPEELGVECLSSSSDLDYVSLNSLDDNSVDLDKDIKEPPGRSSISKQEPDPLSAVVSGRKAGRSKKEDLSFTNSSLNTTDL